MSELKHIGTPRHSGRYPWGSGQDPQQRNTSFLGRVDQLHKQGMSDLEIAVGLGITTSELRRRKTIEKEAEWLEKSAFATRLKEKGLSNVAIAKRMGGISDHTVAAYLDPVLQDKAKITKNLANVLADAVDKQGQIDVGSGNEVILGVSRTKLDTAIAMLEGDTDPLTKTKTGPYKLNYVNVEQQGTLKNTSMRILAPSDKPYAEVYKDRFNTGLVYGHYSEDGGRSMLGLEPIQSVSSDRIHIRYKEDGGADKDGVIELRRGVEDLSLGNARYAQVRVGVDGTHYMKGMAVYGDDIPKGFDIIYNTNKPKGAPFGKVFKPMKTEDGQIAEDNPFGSTVKQKHYVDSKGNKKLSPLNIVGTEMHPNEEGAWGEWSKTLSSQFLSKQPPALAKKQLAAALSSKQKEFDEIMALTNPAVKKRLLQTFADETDSAAVKLDAAAMPRQSTRVLLAFPTIKENEIFAPSYDDGETVVLIRHPHGGIFEIPELTVNNKNPEALKVLSANPKDAVGINAKVAQKLSGADFDGDTVLVIPNRNGEIRSKPSLRALKDFDTKAAYPGYPGMPKLRDKAKQRLMGEVSNLITDMTIKGANDDEIARAVKHSMVVIDAAYDKHNLNWRQSAIDNNIADLKRKYQGGPTSGASTLISRAGSDQPIPLRKEQTGINPVTGEKTYKYLTNQFVINSKGKKVRLAVDSKEEAKKIGLVTYTVNRKKVIDPETGKITYKDVKEKQIPRQSFSTKMAETSDARSLISTKSTPIEMLYADHANGLKSIANKARLAYLSVEDIPYSRSANITYSKEVESLNNKLNIAFRNKPHERQAQLLAGKIVSAKRQANPNLEAPDLKKIRGQALIEARSRAGAQKIAVEITDKEWEAIQAGAISKNKLYQMLLNADLDALKQRAMPKTNRVVSDSDVSKARTMRAAGRTTAEIARVLGVSTSTVSKVLE